MKNILLPTDLSENSKHAIKYALCLHENEVCNFYFLHTYTPAIYSFDYQMSLGSTDFYNNFHDITKENVISFVNEITNQISNNNFTFHTLVEYNILTDSVAENVKKFDIDLIIMGTKGATSSSKILFGTNTIQVINKRVCPVLAVPETYKIQQPKEILFPTDLHVNYTDQQLKIMLDIATNYNAKVQVFHVLYRGLTSGQRKSKEILEKAIEKINSDILLAEYKEIPVAITEYMEQNNVDLLMMINNKHLFFENLFFKPVISKIAMDLKIPLLVISAK